MLTVWLGQQTGHPEIFRGLYPAWGRQLLWLHECNYIWELLCQQQGVRNIPILLCGDDLDFSCTILLAQTRFSQDSVCWEKIGERLLENWALTDELRSGILHTESWSEADWANYGSSLAWCQPNDLIWQQWIHAHWQDESDRRIRNYTHPYLQRPENIGWLPVPALTFPKDEYLRCVAHFRSALYRFD